MTAECTRTKLRFQGLDGRDVVGRFDGGEITSDAGGVRLREVEQRTRILGRLSECFTDHRDPDRIEHSVVALTKQRVLGLCLGYEDLNDHDELCRDRLLALLVRPGRPDGGVPARGVGSRQTAGRQEHPEPTGADSVGGTGGRVQEDRGRPGGDGRTAAGPDYSSRKHKMSKRARHVESDQRVTRYPQKTDGIRPG